MVDNIPEYYAAYIRDNVTFANVYSNIDPTRNWNGETIVEIGEPDEATFVPFISGDYLIKHTIVATCRAQTRDVAGRNMQGVKSLLVNLNELLLKNNEIEAWSIENEGATPDIRGIVAGDSFYGYLEFSITEKKRN